MEFGATIPKTGIPFDRFNVVSRRYYLKRKDELMNRGILRNNMIVTLTGFMAQAPVGSPVFSFAPAAPLSAWREVYRKSLVMAGRTA